MAMRSSVWWESVPWRSSERKRAYPRSAAGEPASTPRKLGSWPPVASAPRRTGTEPSGAVSSSWIWKRLMEIFFMAMPSRRRDGMAGVRAEAYVKQPAYSQ